MPDDTPPVSARPSPFSQVREVGNLAPLGWLRNGWADMRARLLPSLFYGLCFAFGGYFIIWILRDTPEYVPAVTTGFLITGPFMAMGLYEISRRREMGEACSPMQTLTVWRKNAGQLGVFALILLLIYLVWARASMLAFALFYSGGLPTYKDFMMHVIRTDNIEFMLMFFGVGSLFAAFTFAISLVSIPLILDRGYDAITASLTSANALATNPGAMIVWSGLISILAIGGLLTFLLGIIVIGPLLGHATWHAYRELIAPDVPGAAAPDR